MPRRFSLIFAVAALTLTSAFAGGGSSTVSTNSVKVLGSPGRRAGQEWEASTAYAQGEVVSVGSTYFFALVAGTSGATAPSGLADVADGTVTWRQSLQGPRKGLFLSNEGSARVTVNWFTVEAGAGITLAAGEKIVLTGGDTPQVAVHMIADSGSQSVSVLEW